MWSRLQRTRKHELIMIISRLNREKKKLRSQDYSLYTGLEEGRLTTEHKERERAREREGSVLVWLRSELKSGERMLMICRENEARPDESPAKVFRNTKKLGEGEKERGREGERVKG